jgi:hypothetical protein
MLFPENFFLFRNQSDNEEGFFLEHGPGRVEGLLGKKTL